MGLERGEQLTVAVGTRIVDIAYQNKAVIYDLLFKASAETTLTIAADPTHLGARIGVLSVLHTWGSALTHHPHVHMIVLGGGLSPDGSTWIACRPNYFLTVQVLSALFRRLFLEMLAAAHDAGRLHFFGNLSRLADGRRQSRNWHPRNVRAPVGFRHRLRWPNPQRASKDDGVLSRDSD
jgi:hypothetical protein